MNPYRLMLLLLLLSGGIVPALHAQESKPAACLAEGTFDSTVNYFPEQVRVDYAAGFTVEYFNSYKLVTVTAPFPGATAADARRYLLVQCGAPTPDGYADALVVSVPVQRVMALSSTFFPHLTELDQLDTLVGVDTLDWTNNAAILARGEAGQFVQVGSGPAINLELTVETQPDVVFVFASPAPEYDSHPTLLEAGIPTVILGDWAETTPLGRAEWLKFTALFYNAEAEAERLFDEKADAYNALVEAMRALEAVERPLVLWDSFNAFGEAWYVPGSASYVAQLLTDAGAQYVLGDAPEAQEQTGSVPFSFEVVYDAGLNADVWLPGSFGVNTLADLLAQDERYADFAALQTGRVFSLGARMNANGGDDYFETGVTNPQIVLADLVLMFHPERARSLLPDHTLYFFRPLTNE